MPGQVHLVGAGPGAGDLITLRGQRLLGRAEVLVYDAPCDPALLEAVPATAERVPVGRWPDLPMMGQSEINALLVERARAGKRVVRLKNGDPLVFGRGGEEAAALAEAGLSFEIVPGISAGFAAAALTGVPVSQRGIASEICCAIVQSGGVADWGLDLDRLAASSATLILYLAPVSLGPLASELTRRGRDPATPVAVVERVSSPEQRVFVATLADVAEQAAGAEAPIVALVGEAVRLRATLAWMERRPLHGRSIVVTRARTQAAEMAAALEELGAEVLVAPCIEVAAPPSWEPLDRAIERLADFDWLVFTSANGVEAFLSRLPANRRDTRALAGLRLAAIGARTAESLRAAHLSPDLVPDRFDAEALAAALARIGVQGLGVLVVRALHGRELLAEELGRLGARVTLAPAYQTVRPSLDPEPIRRRAREGRLSAVSFASPSAVRNFVEQFDEGEGVRLLAGTVIAAIGPTTAAAVGELGLRALVQPEDSTASSLVKALAAHLGNSPAD